MRKIWTILIAISLGSSIGGCANWKCTIPDLLPKFCQAGPGASPAVN
jgi:hypothetical protein